MKKKIFTLAFAAATLLCGCNVQARPSASVSASQDDGMEALFKQFRNSENVTYLNLPKSLIKMGLKSADDKTAEALAARIDRIQILTLEEAGQKTKDDLFRQFSNLEKKGYEPVVKSNDDGEKVRILIKGNEKEVQNLIIFSMDKDDCSLVSINGHINPADIDEIVELETH